MRARDLIPATNKIKIIPVPVSAAYRFLQRTEEIALVSNCQNVSLGSRGDSMVWRAGKAALQSRLGH
jgi:hypothetical protein